MRLVSALAIGAVAVSAADRRHKQTLSPQDGHAFADAELRQSVMKDEAKKDNTTAWWLPPASAYIAAGMPAASVGLYGGASAPTVAGTYTPYPYYYPSAGYPASTAGYPYYGYYPTAPYAAVAGSPSGYTNVYSVLSGQYRFRGAEAAGAEGGAQQAAMPPRFAQADMEAGAESESASTVDAQAEAAAAQAQAAYHAHASQILSEAAAAAQMHGYSSPAWTDFARPQAAAASSAYSAAQRAHVMRLQEEERASLGHVSQAADATEELVPAGSHAVASESSVSASSALERGHRAARGAIDEEIAALETLAQQVN